MNDGEIINVQWSGKAGSPAAALRQRRPAVPTAAHQERRAAPSSRSSTCSCPSRRRCSRCPAVARSRRARSPASGVSTWVTPVPALSGRCRSSTPARWTPCARPACAARRRWSPAAAADMSAAADGLAAAGHAPCSRTRATGPPCAGTIGGTAGAARVPGPPARRRRLLPAAPGSVTGDHDQQPAYVYDLADRWSDRVPGRRRPRRPARHVAALVETSTRSAAPPPTDGLGLFENMTGIWPTWATASSG